MNEEAPEAQAETQKSGFLYRTVTRYWPRIAGGIVVLGAILGWVLDALTVERGMEFYIFAWATVTGGLWFMSEKAEKALSEESRNKVVGWIDSADFRDSIKSIPPQFAMLFDRIFGEKHWSWRCFFRSALASFPATFLTLVILMAFDLEIGRAIREAFHSAVAEFQSVVLGTLALLALLGVIAVGLVVVVNSIQDYVSLLETRWMIRRLDQVSLVTLLCADFVATAVMASGKSRHPGAIDKRGDSYRIRLCVDRQRYVFSVRGVDRREAERIAREKDEELRRRSRAGLLGQMLVSELLDRYTRAKLPELAPNTQKT